MSEQQQQHLKQLLYSVLERKNKTINTIYNDSNQYYIKQLRTTIEQLRITEKSFETDVTAIVAMTFKESETYGYIASVLIFSMELDVHLTKNSSMV